MSYNRNRKTGSSTLTLAAVLIASTLASVSLFMTDGSLQSSGVSNTTDCDSKQLEITSAVYKKQDKSAQVRISNPGQITLHEIKVSVFANQSPISSTQISHLESKDSSRVVFDRSNLTASNGSSRLVTKMKVAAIPLHCPTLSAKRTLSVN